MPKTTKKTNEKSGESLNKRCAAYVKGVVKKRCSRQGKTTVRDGRCFCAQHAKKYSNAPFCETCQTYQQLALLPCGHKFCYDCLATRGRVENNPTCPQCMSAFNPWYHVFNIDDMVSRLSGFTMQEPIVTMDDITQGITQIKMA